MSGDFNSATAAACLIMLLLLRAKDELDDDDEVSIRCGMSIVGVCGSSGNVAAPAAQVPGNMSASRALTITPFIIS